MKNRQYFGLFLLVCAFGLSATATGVDAGVVYEVSGFETPADESVVVAAGSNTIIHTAYSEIVPETGAIRCTLTPAGAVSAGARWAVLNDGSNLVWQTSGAVVSGLEPGSYMVFFKMVEGYDSPAARSVNVQAGQTTEIAGAYAGQTVGPVGIHYVSLSGGHVPPFASWATAATNIQDAIDAATIPGALVLVSNGVYSTGAYPTPSGSAHDSRIVVTSAVSVVSMNGPEHTTIMGAHNVHCAYLAHGARLSGFTLDAEGSGPRGGVKCYAGAVLEHCVVRNGNNCDGGNVSSHSATVRNCLLTGGISYRGGGIFLYGPEARLEHCTIVSNRARKGGGVFCEGGAVINCIVWSNSANESGANWALQGGTITYSCTTPDPGGVGNMTGHPVLSADYALSSNSPCIDAGMDMPSITTDINGTPRPLDGNNDGTAKWDIGAYEFVNALADTDGDGFSDADELAAGTDPRDPTSHPAAKVHYVSLSGGHVPPFASWATAATNIQAAIDVAVASNTVLVADGVYETGGRVVHGSMTNRVVINKGIMVKSVNGPEVTIIKGAGPLGASAVRCVYLASNAVLEGFTLTEGHTRTTFGFVFAERDGGGAWCESSAVLSNCVIQSNTARSDGGGVYGGILRGCIVVSNTAYHGGGVFGATLHGCQLTGNTAQSGGGGAQSVLDKCTLLGNVADYGGGTYKSTVNHCRLVKNRGEAEGGGSYKSVLSGCYILYNSADRGGGVAFGQVDHSVLVGNTANEGAAAYGIRLVSSGGQSTNPWPVYAAEVVLRHCVVMGNRATVSCGGIYCGMAYNCVVINNFAPRMENYAFAQNRFGFAGRLSYCCTTPDPGGTGTITNNPMMASVEHLSVNSPCIGAGHEGYVTAMDIDGETWQTPPSIGCDEVVGGSITGDLRVSVDVSDTLVGPGATVTFAGFAQGRVSRSSWNFGDGSPVVDNQGFCFHQFNAPGLYDVVYRAYNETHPEGVATTVAVHVIEATYYVSLGSQTSAIPFSSWETAATNIQDAIDVAIPGSVVLVGNGVYETGGRVVFGKQTNRIVIGKEIRVRSLNGPEVTTIVGAGPRGDSSIRCAFVGKDATLSGFTLTNGHTRTARGRKDGGGAWCDPSAVLSNCVVTGNAAEWGGGVFGGIINNCRVIANTAYEGGGASHATLNRCTLSLNQAVRGGGSHESTLNYCLLTENSASLGGGIWEGELNNCVLTGNKAEIGGGSGYGVLNNCLLVDNVASEDAGGAYNGQMNNCTLIRNTAVERGGGACDSTLRNCIVYHNEAQVYPNIDAGYWGISEYCCTIPDPGGAGNITNAPMFVDAENGNFQIRIDSPCIDAGMDMPLITTDINGTPRPLDGNNDGTAQWDIGAYEYDAHTIDSDGDGMLDHDELRAGYSPLDSADFFQLLVGSEQAGERSLHGTRSSQGFSLQWNSVEGRRYNVYRSTNLLAGFTLLQGPIDAQPPVNTYPSMIEEERDSLFYRIELAE